MTKLSIPIYLSKCPECGRQGAHFCTGFPRTDTEGEWSSDSDKERRDIDMSGNILKDIKVFIGRKSVAPSDLVSHLHEKGHEVNAVQSTIHKAIDMGDIELGPGLNLRLRKARR